MDQPRALIIVDSLDIASLDFRQTLDISGYVTELVIQGHLTLDQIGQIQPTIIFLHYSLPDMPDLNLIRKFQDDEHLKDVPVVGMAAYQDVANALFPLATVVLLKPVNSDRLTRLISLLRSMDQFVEKSPWDALTGLYNPSYFMARLEQAIKRSQQMERGEYLVFAINLEQLMNYEKKFGKEYRQYILQGFANTLKKVLRPTDIVARFEANQFLVLIEDSVDRFAPAPIANRMQGEFDEFLSHAGLKNRIKIDIAVVYCSTAYKKSDEVLKDAQAALSMAKHDRDNGYKVFERTILPDRTVGLKSLVSA